ncbi:MAG: MFS transporter [Thaumarchaeota archaeon]|nr:MFS transporter [Nitrososphaerota archaeon]
MLSSAQRTKALGSLIFARVIYAVNWVNVGAIFYLMGSDLGVGISGLGTVTATFYLGLGVMQLPGGLLAAKWGPKRVVVIGIFLSSLSVLGTSVSTSLAEVAVLRFLVGWGMAFVFAPAVIMVSGLLRGGKSGMGVGLLNSAFDVGGMLGIFGWVVIATVTGWRPSLMLSGGMGVLTGLLVAVFTPSDRDGALPRVDRSSLRTVIFDKQLVLLGLGTMGFGIIYTEVSGFMTLYGVNFLGASGIVSSLVASLLTVVPIFTALWGGRAFDFASRHRTIMVLSMLGSAGALALTAYPSLAAAAVSSALGGIIIGVGYTFAFAGARELNRAGKEYESLAVAWVNSISLTGSVFPSIFFSYVAESFGYGDAWLWSGLLTLAFVVPFVLMVEKWRR